MSSESTAPQANMVDSPLSLPRIALTFDNSDPDTSARNLIEEFCPHWVLEDGPLKFTRFTDGITNTLTKATKRWPGKTESQIDQEAILIRAYGKGTDALIDRERELKSHNLLANLGLAPPLLARFDNGLMYRFIEGHPCTPEDLRRPAIYRQVAKRLGQWHGTLPTSAITSTPSGKLGQRHSSGKDGKEPRPTPNTWTVMQSWIEALPSQTEKERERITILTAELAELSARFGDMPGLDSRYYIFGHCDLLSGNVIVNHPSGTDVTQNGDSDDLTVSFIDYEYATASPAAFDIANHFAEWAGFDCDHGAVPTRSQRRDFLKHYVGSFRYHSISDTDSLNAEIDMHNDVVTLFDQIEQFRGIPGFYWGIWALIQATISTIDFDYASYAELRLGEYWAWKAETDGSRAREGREMPLRERRWAED